MEAKAVAESVEQRADAFLRRGVFAADAAHVPRAALFREPVFLHGEDFWHSCPLHATKPRNNAAFWEKKLASNKARDRLVRRVLQREGWRVLRLWEHELARKREASLVRRIQKALTSP